MKALASDFDGTFYFMKKNEPIKKCDIEAALDEIQGKVHSITYNALTEKFVDIIPDGCSKGMGIDIVRNILKIDTFAGIGDSMNDSPMLENVDIAFTFPYAPKALQEKASQIVNSVAEAIHSMV